MVPNDWCAVPSKWKRLDLDKGVWNIAGAIDASGRQFDLRIDAKSRKVISTIAE